MKTTIHQPHRPASIQGRQSVPVPQQRVRVIAPRQRFPMLQKDRLDRRAQPPDLRIQPVEQPSARLRPAAQ
jgi:hypothetical protein